MATIVEDFEHYGRGAFPARWRARSDDARKIYRVGSELGHCFLRAHAHNQGVEIGLDYVFDPAMYARLSWRWRVLTFPSDSDECLGKKHDAAAQVYVEFDDPTMPRAINYMWSARLSVGTRFTNPLDPFGPVIVLRSGATEPNRWSEEEVHFLDDYRKLFDAEPVRILGIGILTSSNATQSVATADYDAFALLP